MPFILEIIVSKKDLADFNAHHKARAETQKSIEEIGYSDTRQKYCEKYPADCVFEDSIKQQEMLGCRAVLKEYGDNLDK